MEKTKNKASNKFKKIIIPVFLLLLWIFLTLFYIFNNNFSLSVISYPGSKSNFTKYTPQRLLKGKIIRGKFVAKENYLGIVTVSFSTFSQIAYEDEDMLLFRIKEAKSENWYYQNTYKSGLIYQVPVFPFGFPKIADSKGKTYIFEIESLSGNSKNSIAISRWEPILLTRYQIPKSLLLQDKSYLLSFFVTRVIVASTRQDVQFFSYIYFLPFLLYVLLFFLRFLERIKPLVVKIKKKISNTLYRNAILLPLYYFFKYTGIISLRYFDVVILILILINIFYIPFINDVALIVAMILWVHVSNFYKDDSKKSFVVGILLLVLCPLALSSGSENIAEKSAVWAYMFFLVGVIQIFLDELRMRNNSLEISSSYQNRLYLPFLKKTMTTSIDFMVKNRKDFFEFLYTYFFGYIFVKNRKKVYYLLGLSILLICFFTAQRIIANEFLGNPCIETKISSAINKRGPSVQKIEPDRVHYGDKVVITGQGFDWTDNKPLKIMTNYGEIKADYWDSNKIIITIPLDFKEGNYVYFWLGTPSSALSKAVPRANFVKVKLLSRLGAFTKDDISYLRQARCLTPTARYINNFTNFKLGRYRNIITFFLKII